MERRVVVWVWRLVNIAVFVFVGGFAASNYLTLMFYEITSPGDLPILLAMLTVLVLCCIYHLYRLVRPRVPEIGPTGWRRTGWSALSASFEACLLLAAWIVLYGAAMGFGELIYAYLYMWPPNAMEAIVSAEQDHHRTKGVYTDKFADLAAVAPWFRDRYWSKPRFGYDFKITVSEGGKHFAAVGIAGPARKDKRAGFYADDSGVIRTAPEGTTPDKNSRELYH
jgi:hypothetical protein